MLTKQLQGNRIERVNPRGLAVPPEGLNPFSSVAEAV